MVGLLVSTFNMHTNGRRISRVVVHPSYRGCGIGKAIVKKYLHDYPDTDVLAAMAMYNPIFEKCGMTRVNDTEIKPPNGIEKRLSEYDFDFSKWGEKPYLECFVNQSIMEMLSEYARYATSVVCPAGKRLSVDEIKTKIKTEKQTAIRVLFSFRPRTMARYINK